MSISKRLARQYSKNEASAEAINGLLNRFGLTSIAQRLRVHVHAQVMQQALYDTIHVRTAEKLTSDALRALIDRAGLPQGVPTVVTVDSTMLSGTELTYGGKKYSSNAKEKLNRFVTSKNR
jgi:F0F1-type ATP synthase delta subunit